MKPDPELEQEWLRQNNLGYGALIAIGVVMVQPFLTAGAPDLSARVCIVAFSLAIPLLAALVLLNRQEVFRRRRARSVPVAIAQVAAQVCAFVDTELLRYPGNRTRRLDHHLHSLRVIHGGRPPGNEMC